MSYQYKITVFTPTYNRAYILEELYTSLCRQTCFDFEWLIVDDGSTDNTQELVSAWSQTNRAFPIRHIRQKNGGKHRAINHGVTIADGELFFIVDSDDTLPPNSIETTLRWVQSLPKNESFCGVCGLKAFSLTESVGTSFNAEFLDCTALEREKYGISGDKAEVFFTNILQKYPFPEFEGEKFVTEAVVWDKMAADGYRLRFFNEIIYLCEYRSDGLTHQGSALYYRNPQGYGLYLRQCRRLNKFPSSVQSYYEIQCYLAWRRCMPLHEIAKLLDLNGLQLWVKSWFYQCKQAGSKIKRKLISIIRSNT